MTLPKRPSARSPIDAPCHRGLLPLAGALVAALLALPAGSVTLAPGDMLVTQLFGGTPNGFCNGSIIKVAADGSQEFVADNTGNFCTFRDAVIDSNGDAWTVGNNFAAPGNAVFHLDLGTGVLTEVTNQGFLSGPERMALDEDENLLITNSNTPQVSRVDTGTSGQSLVSSGNLLQGPNGIDVADDGTIFVADFNPSTGGFVGDVLTIDPDTGMQDLIATTGSLPTARGVALGPDGLVYVSSTFGTARQVFRFDPGTGNEELVWSATVSIEDIAFLPDGRLAVVSSAEIFAVDVDAGTATTLSAGGLLSGATGIFVLPEPGAAWLQAAGAAAVVALARRRRGRARAS